nr:1-phosphofructokinase family hexose kinase [Enterovirga sp. DB1703]
MTLNPAIDGAAEAEQVRPIRKIRTSNERYFPGGGGINVARVVRELGGSALALYLSGGVPGPLLDALLDATGIPAKRIPIADHTRISHVVFERSTGLEYRFVPEGPEIAPAEWQAALDAVRELDFAYIVASGSLPPGVPADFYVRVAAIAAEKRAKLVLDSSGEALRRTLGRGVLLVKPSLGELESIVGKPLRDPASQEREAVALARSGAAEIVAVTLGSEGALLATRDGTLRLAPPPVEAKSAVGAGDSFVGAMTLALAQGRAVEDAFALGLCAGSAAVLSVGTELCKREDVERLYAALPPAPRLASPASPVAPSRAEH